jgi:hypothetical protein
MFYDSDPFLRAALSGRPRPICTLIPFYICFFLGRHLGQASDALCILRIGAILPCRFRSWVLQGRWIPTMTVVIIFFLFHNLMMAILDILKHTGGGGMMKRVSRYPSL